MWCLPTIVALIMYCAMQVILKKDLKFYFYFLLEFMTYGNVIMISLPSCWMSYARSYLCLHVICYYTSTDDSLIWFFWLQFSFSLYMFLFRISKADDSFARRLQIYKLMHCMRANGTRCFCRLAYMANSWWMKKLSISHNHLFYCMNYKTFLWNSFIVLFQLVCMLDIHFLSITTVFKPAISPLCLQELP